MNDFFLIRNAAASAFILKKLWQPEVALLFLHAQRNTTACLLAILVIGQSSRWAVSCSKAT